jgi:zinc protease
MLKTSLLRKSSYCALSAFLLIQSCSHAPQTRVDQKTGLPETAAVVKEGDFEVIPVIGNFVVKKAVLKNGLTLLILKDESSPTFAYQTWFKVGSRNEVIGKTGLAHLFEHLMFKGTKNHKEGEFDALLEQAGAEGENAFTTNDHTVYVQEMPKDHLDLISSLESDRMVNLIVNDDSFKTEREVVQNERRFRKENSPEGSMYQTLFETAFTTHPYHWPVIGYEQDLNLMSAQDARDFYERYYSPDRAIVVVVGDVNEKQVLKRVEKLYGSIPAKNAPDGVIPEEPDQTAQRRKKLQLSLQNEKVWMAYKVPAADAPQTPVFEVIQGLLTDGMNSRLNRALVDSGVATGVSSGSFSMKDPGLFVFMADLQKGKGSILAESIIQRELERLKNAPVPEEELKRAKNLIRFHFYERMSTSNGKANFLGESESRYGNFQGGLNLQRKIQEVTPEMIQDAAQKYFVTKKLTVVVGVPKAN